MTVPENVEGRCIVITGAGRGLGAAFAIALADAGARAKAILTGRTPGPLESMRDAITRRTGQRPDIQVLDLSSPLDAAQIARDLADPTEGIDRPINNAAKWQTGSLGDHDDAKIAAVINTHVTELFWSPRRLLPHSQLHRLPTSSTSSRPPVFPTPRFMEPQSPSMQVNMVRPE